MNNLENWFCLNVDGLLYDLGRHDCFDSAEEEAERKGLEVVWIFGEDSMRSWRDSLNTFAEKVMP